MIDTLLTEARLDLYDRAGPTPAYIDYVRRHGVDTMKCGWFAGVMAVVAIAEYPNRRFDFSENGDLAFVCEAYGADGETVTDLVAWPMDRPADVRTMFGRAGLLGLWQAMAAGTYTMGNALVMHPTPLAWLQSGCDGAAIADEHIAARQLLDLPGRLAAHDAAHGRKLRSMLRAAAGEDRVLIPGRRAA